MKFSHEQCAAHLNLCVLSSRMFEHKLCLRIIKVEALMIPLIAGIRVFNDLAYHAHSSKYRKLRLLFEYNSDV